jgi:hypothetical protein
MKKSLQTKLKAYSAVAGSLAAASAGAQVIYTDVNPDFVCHDTDIYVLDLNNDVVPDFVFVTYDTTMGSYSIGVAMALPYGPGNAIVGSLYYGVYPMPYSLNTGDSIKANSATWHNDTVNGGTQYLGVLYNPGNNVYGNWVGVNDKYVGLRINVAGQFHYGWARLSVSPTSDTIIIKDYAYQELPNVGITAGQIVGVPSQSTPAGMRVHAYQHTAFVNVANPQDGGVVEIYDMTGNLVRTAQIVNNETVIDLGDQPVGIYMIHVRQGDIVYSQKVYIR